MTNRTLFRATAALCIALTLTLLLMPGLVLWLFGLETADAAQVLARRAGMLFLGLAILYGTLAGTPHPEVRRALNIAGLTFMTAIAALGLIELALGRVGPGVTLAVAVEIGFALLFAAAIRRG